MINISNLNKEDVLVALYNNAKPQGMGFLHFTPEQMTKEEVQALLQNQTYFDYLKGRIMKVDLSKDELDPWLYDRDNGQGAAQAAIDKIQKG